MNYFTFSGTQTISLPKNANNPVITEILGNYTSGINWNINFLAENCCIKIGNSTPIELENADYALNITTDGIYIRGKDYNSMMHGFADMLERTLCYDYHLYKAECGLFRETAKIKFRSAHLCIFPETTLEFLRKTVRACGIAKYSHIILEFWGMLKFDCLKELGWDFAYSKQQIKEIVNEANALGIEIIPMFNHLGHASLSREGASGKHVVLDQNLEYDYLYKPNSYGWVWDYSKPSVLKLLTLVRDELIEMCGNGQYFHLGFDESGISDGDEKTALELCEYLDGLKNELAKKGRTAIIWGDMLLSQQFFPDSPKRSTGGGVYECNSTKDFAEHMLKNLSKDIIIADWQYEVCTENWKSSELLKKKGFKVICCTFAKRQNLKTGIDTVTENDLVGIMRTTWHTLSSNFPVLMQAGFSSWTGDYLPDYKYYAAMSTRSTAILRKVESKNSDYKDHGWSYKQIGPGL